MDTQLQKKDGTIKTISTPRRVLRVAVPLIRLTAGAIGKNVPDFQSLLQACVTGTGGRTLKTVTIALSAS